jgi:hypothetical protein
VISGSVSNDGVPVITLEVAGQAWSAIIDTGFNGDLELPDALRGKLNDQPAGRLRSALAGGRIVEEDAFSVEFPFDGFLSRNRYFRTRSTDSNWDQLAPRLSFADKIRQQSCAFGA